MVVSALPPLIYLHNIPVSSSRIPAADGPHRDRSKRTPSCTERASRVLDEYSAGGFGATSTLTNPSRCPLLAEEFRWTNFGCTFLGEAGPI